MVGQPLRDDNRLMQRMVLRRGADPEGDGDGHQDQGEDAHQQEPHDGGAHL